MVCREISAGAQSACHREKLCPTACVRVAALVRGAPAGSSARASLHGIQNGMPLTSVTTGASACDAHPMSDRGGDSTASVHGGCSLLLSPPRIGGCRCLSISAVALPAAEDTHDHAGPENATLLLESDLNVAGSDSEGMHPALLLLPPPRIGERRCRSISTISPPPRSRHPRCVSEHPRR